MKQKTITTDKATLLLVETENIDKSEDGHWIPNNEGGYMHIPFDQYQLLGSLPDITEDDAKLIVDFHLKGGLLKCYYNYERGYYSNSLYTALNSLHSLLQANEVYFKNPFGFRYTKGWDAETDYRSFLRWHEAQSKVFDKDRTYFFIKVD